MARLRQVSVRRYFPKPIVVSASLMQNKTGTEFGKCLPRFVDMDARQVPLGTQGGYLEETMTFEAFDANGRWVGRLSFPITTLLSDILYVAWKHDYTLELTGVQP